MTAKHLCSILPACMLALLLTAWQAAAADGFQRNLSQAEIALAIKLAAADSGGVPGDTVALRGAALAPLQILLVDIRLEKSAARQRLAEVFRYNYLSERTEYRLIDLAGERLLLARDLQQHHLPLNQAERRFAREQVARHAEARQRLESELRRFNAAAFSELQSKVFIHEPLPSDPTPCAVKRCARLSYTGPQRLALSLEPIVVMASGEVLLTRTGAR